MANVNMISNEPPKYDEIQPGFVPNYGQQPSYQNPNAPSYPPPVQPGYYVPPGNVPYPPSGQGNVNINQPLYPQNTTTTILTQPQLTAAFVVTFNQLPVRMQCPYCQAQVVTTIEFVSGLLVWLLFLGMFFFGFWICCFFPFCMDGCKDVIHSCPNCKKVIGTYRRM